SEGRSESFRRRFLGAHFYNPPRYLYLLELIPTPDTAPEVLAAVRAFGDRRDEERRNAALETRVAERTAELSEANERLREEMVTRESAEAALRQGQKMEAVGQLTGGIAHDFNNMLAVVIGGVEMAKRRLGGNADATRHLDNAMEGANRAAALTKRLLAFARAEPLLPVATDAGNLIADMSELLDRSIGDTIAVRIEAAADGWPVFVDRHQLENALLNLAVNARDAMERGGTMTITTANVTLNEGEIVEADAGDYVRISVGDTGIGMTQAVLDRIFEPFFTTKPTGKGTGLGLSQIFGFVRQSGGTIAVESTPGAGTIVSLYLPRHTAEAVAERPVRLATDDSGSRHERRTVLVIEDDPRVLSATVDALEEIGHHAIPCATATDAPKIVSERPEIGLIVSDVLMPGVTGPELIAAIGRAHPGLPVLFVTGFAGDIGDGLAFGGHEVLRKPFTIAALGDAVDRALDKTPPVPAQAA
ncbi:MAG: response regulator, partial [Sphingomonadaceae bacterium]|nr:response regulator [Sphingomonadaceae bacterium]